MSDSMVEPTTGRVRPPVHPGEVLLADFMEPLGLSQNRLALEISLAAPTINGIIHGRRSVTAPVALRLGRYFGTSAEVWLNLQTRYDLEMARMKVGAEVERTVRPRSVAA